MTRVLVPVKKRLTEILWADQRRWFWVEQLAALVYAGKPIGKSELESVRRALRGLDIQQAKVRRWVAEPIYRTEPKWLLARWGKVLAGKLRGLLLPDQRMAGKSMISASFWRR